MTKGLTNCIFLYLGKKGICIENEGKKVCYHKCDRFAEVGDEHTAIAADWDYEIERARLNLQRKYFGTVNVEEYKKMKDLLG